MWTCPRCLERIEADFDVCWQCGTTADGRTDAKFQSESDDAAESDLESPASHISQPQFSLRGLFILVTLLGLALALIVNWNTPDSLVVKVLLAFAFGVTIAAVVSSFLWFVGPTAHGQCDD